MNCRIMLFEALSIDDGKYYPRFGYNTDPCIGIGTRSFDSERGSGEFYKENAFLRDIKVNYLRYGKLTERQVEAFKKVVQKMKERSSD